MKLEPYYPTQLVNGKYRLINKIDIRNLKPNYYEHVVEQYGGDIGVYWNIEGLTT